MTWVNLNNSNLPLVVYTLHIMWWKKVFTSVICLLEMHNTIQMMKETSKNYQMRDIPQNIYLALLKAAKSSRTGKAWETIIAKRRRGNMRTKEDGGIPDETLKQKKKSEWSMHWN